MDEIVAECGLPHIEDDALEDTSNPKDRLYEILDKVEVLVEKMRKEALMIEEEKDQLFSTLDTIKNSELLIALEENDKDDIFRFIDRLSTRCLTVDVSVHTHRDPVQEEALYQVNNLIDSLVTGMKADPKTTKSKCLSYMAACSSNPQGICDTDFECVILGCTVDDQKKIKKRLQGLLQYIERALAVTVNDFE